MKPKAVIYSRISTGMQSNESQIQDLKNYANYENLEVVQVYEDIISGKTKGADRKGFKQLLEYIETNEIEHVLIWELSRLGRNLLDVITNINILTQKKISVFSKKEKLHTLNDDKTINASGTLMLNLFGSISEYERTTIVERTTRGLHFALKNGANFNTPYGYMGLNKKLAINPNEAKTVKEIYKMFLSGINSPSISKHLNSNNILTKKGCKWTDAQIRDILHNPLYYGQRQYSFGIVSIPAIITKAQHTKAQHIFNNNLNLNQDKRMFQSYLSGLIKCGKCDLNYFQHARVSRTDFAYKCQSHRQQSTGQIDKKCGNHSIGINWLNSMVYYALINNSTYLVNSKKYKDYSGKINEEARKELSKTTKSIKILENEIKTLTNNLNRLTSLVVNGTITEQEFINQKDSLKSKIEKKTEQQNQLLLIKQQLDQTTNIKGLKHFVTGESFKEHIKTFVQSITINKVEVTDNAELKETIPTIHHNRITKIQVKTIFKEYVFYSVVGFPKHSFQLTVNNLRQITLIKTIVQ